MIKIPLCGSEECHQTDLSLLEWLREHLSMSLQDPGAVIEGVEVGHIVTLHISPEYFAKILISLLEAKVKF